MSGFTSTPFMMAPRCCCLLLFFILGCGTQKSASPPKSEAPAKTQPQSQPHSVDDFEPIYQSSVEVKAQYISSPIAGGKRLQVVSLRLENGEVWIRSYRTIPNERAKGKIHSFEA